MIETTQDKSGKMIFRFKLGN